MEKKEDIRKKAKRYQTVHLQLLPIRLVFNLVIVCLLLFANISHAYTNFLETLVRPNWLIIILYFTGLAIAYSTVTFPLSFYEGYTTEHKFNLSVQSLPSWLWDYVKGFLISLIIGLPLMEAVYYLLKNYPNYWWIWAGLVFILFAIVLANLAPILIFPLFYKFEPIEDEELKERLTRLASGAGTKVKGVYKMGLAVKSRTAEAALMGLGNTRRIILSDTLLDNYRPEEIEVVLAHELAHHHKGHIPKLIASQAILTMLALYFTSWVLKEGVSYLSLGEISSVANFPLLILALSTFAILTLPLSNIYSRYLEKEADTYAIKLTNQPQAFISGIKKLADQNLSDLDPNPLVEFCLYDHPSGKKRIQLAKQCAEG